ncbi:MAG: SDR family NAD(P)-dependent oxidoreductase, partial [Pseudomonadota bacterium]
MPRSLFSETPNPAIPFEDLNLRVAQQEVALPTADRRIAGINSFGFGGTNAHVLIEATPPRPVEARAGAAWLTLSAATQAGLAAKAQAAAEMIAQGASPETLGAATARRSPALARRLTVAADADAADALLAAAREARFGSAPVGEMQRPLMLAFSGNGSQWAGMARAERAADPGFAARLEAIDALLGPMAGFGILEALDDPALEERLRATSVAQPLLFAIQAAAADRLFDLGLRPAACVGHSVGEIAAAYASGAISLERGCRLVVVRSRLQEAARGLGEMAVVGLGEAEVRAALSAHGFDDLDIAGVNSPRNVTLAGPSERMAALGALAEARRWVYRPLDLDYPFHSRLLDGFEQAFLDALEFAPEAPHRDVALISTVTGAPIAVAELTARYWWRNLRAPVRFFEAARAAAVQGARIAIEVGPRPVLQSYLRDCFADAGVDGAIAASLDAPSRERAGSALRRSAADVLSAGGSHDPILVYGEDPLGRVPTPKTVWAATAPREEAAAALAAAGQAHPLLGWPSPADPLVWECDLDPKTHPFLADHRVAGEIVFPGAGFVENALAAAAAAFDEPGEVLDLQIFAALTLEPGRPARLRTRVSPDRRLATLESRPYDDADAAWTLHARARIAPVPGARADAVLLSADEQAAAPLRRWSKADVYALGAARGLDYGPDFALVERVEKRSADGYWIELNGAGAPGGDRIGRAAPLDRLQVHPALLDAVLHGLLAGFDDPAWNVDPSLPYVPVHVASVRADPDAGRPGAAMVRIRRASPFAALCDLQLLDGAGRVACSVRGLRVRASAFKAVETPLDRVLLPCAIPIARVDGLDGAPAVAAVEAGRAAFATISTDLAPDQGWALLESAALRVALDIALSTPEAAAEQAALADRRDLLRSALEAAGFAGESADLDAGLRAALAELPEAGDLIAAALAETPACAASAALLAALADDPAAAARATGAAALVEQHWLEHPSAAARLAEIIAVARAFVAAWPEDRPLRVCATGFGGAWVAEEVAVLASAAKAPATATFAAETGRLLAACQARFGDDPAVVVQDARSFEPPSDVFDLWIDFGFGDPAGERLNPAERMAAEGCAILAEAPSRFFEAVVFGARMGGSEASAIEARLRSAGMLDVEARGFSGGGAIGVGFGAAARANQDALAAAAVDHRSLEFVRLDALATEPSAALSAALLHAATALRQAPDGRARIALIAPETGDPALFDALRAFARTAKNEYPDAAILTVRADDEAGLGRRLAAAAAARAARREAIAPDEMARLERLTPARPQRRTGAPESARTLRTARRGRLDMLAWTETARRAPGPDEVEIEIAAAGLNFRDVMWAMNMLPEEALEDGFSGPTLGFEAAGVVTRIGPGVDGLAIGDNVLAFGAELFSTHATVSKTGVAPLPAGVDPVIAAGAPVAELTARYALLERAGLSKGEWLLIHGAAGGVGLAALRVAQEVGAKTIASAGTPEKRALLRALGADIVASSREQAYVEATLAATGGAGVDVVLNSLAGRDMERSLALLRPFGRFCELGKRDYFEDGDLALRAFRRNLSYFGVDLDQVLAARDARPALSALAERLAPSADGGAPATPLAARAYPARAAEDAFRAMQRAEHVGKILVRPPTPETAVRTGASGGRLALDPDGAYLVVGGTSGFGLAAARWLTSRGARKLALLSRRGLVEAEAIAAVDALTADGVDVLPLAADAADEASLGPALDAVRAMGRLRGVVHAAAVFDDRLLATQTEASFAGVLRAKCDSAALLDRLTLGDPLEMFVLFSSATTLFGNPGQSNYVAANGYLEGLARRRRAEGRPAVAPLWGAIGDAGVLTRNAAAAEQLSTRLGEATLSAEEAMASLEAYLLDVDDGAPDAATPVIGRFDWRRAFRELPLLDEARFDALGAAYRRRGDEVDAQDLRRRVQEFGPDAAASDLAGMLRGAVAEVLRMSADEVAVDRPLPEMGLDSLMAVELRAAVEDRFGFEVPISMMSQGVTLAGLAEQIVRRLDDGAETTYETGDAIERSLAERHLGEDARDVMLGVVDRASRRAAE